MALNWFQCKKCGIAIKKDSAPSSSGCSASTFHQWTKLAEVGDINYSCKKCGIVIQAKSTPSSSNCPNSTFHSWTKL